MPLRQGLGMLQGWIDRRFAEPLREASA
jgi:hypothetical protein